MYVKITKNRSRYNSMLLNENEVYTALGIGTIIDRKIKEEMDFGATYEIDIEIRVKKKSPNKGDNNEQHI